MAKKGQKFNKISLETKLEICKKHFEEYIPETPLAREYNLPIGTIRYIFNNYKKGYGFERKSTGRPKEKMYLDSSFIVIKDSSIHLMNTKQFVSLMV